MSQNVSHFEELLDHYYHVLHSTKNDQLQEFVSQYKNLLANHNAISLKSIED